MNFSISDKARAWMNSHIVEKHTRNGKETYGGAVGGRFTFTFVPTSIGTIATVKCACGDEFDDSDWY